MVGVDEEEAMREAKREKARMAEEAEHKLQLRRSIELYSELIHSGRDFDAAGLRIGDGAMRCAAWARWRTPPRPARF